MTFKLTTELARELTERWHDQTLDLESLKFDEANGECVFCVLEEKKDNVSGVKLLLRSKPLQHCWVCVKNVTHVQTRDAEGEVELYINEVETSATSLRVTADNGILEVLGKDLEVSLDVTDAPGETEVSLSTPLGEISWRRKKKVTH